MAALQHCNITVAASQNLKSDPPQSGGTHSVYSYQDLENALGTFGSTRTANLLGQRIQLHMHGHILPVDIAEKAGFGSIRPQKLGPTPLSLSVPLNSTKPAPCVAARYSAVLPPAPAHPPVPFTSKLP